MNIIGHNEPIGHLRDEFLKRFPGCSVEEIVNNDIDDKECCAKLMINPPNNILIIHRKSKNGPLFEHVLKDSPDNGVYYNLLVAKGEKYYTFSKNDTSREMLLIFIYSTLTEGRNCVACFKSLVGEGFYDCDLCHHRICQKCCEFRLSHKAYHCHICYHEYPLVFPTGSQAALSPPHSLEGDSTSET